jgi:homoserine O-succinyltransferase
MPVCLDRNLSGYELSKVTNGLVGESPIEFHESTANCIDIGLLNNMPDAALEATERQFLTLLDSAAGGILVRVSLYALPDVPRADSGCRHISGFYSGIENLWDSHLDGLIVTGTEPRAPNLMDEPYWGSLTRVFDWAQHNTYSTVLSCLGAHAALLHLDGIGRRRLSDKCFGLFDCDRVSNHQLTAGTPSRFPMPQSRWNDIPENEVTASGYQILTRAEDAGIDMFVKRDKSLFVFCQGHPEYSANALLLEYRRDIRRYLRRESDTYPPMPRGYFDAKTADGLTALRERALCGRREELLADFPTARVERRLANTWRSASSCIYGNWLMYLCAQKERQLRRGNVQRNLLGCGTEPVRRFTTAEFK